MLAHIHPSLIRFICRTRPILMATVLPAQSPGPATARQVPGAPLPTKGVTSRGVMSYTSSSPLRFIIQCQSKLCKKMFDAHSISVCISPKSLSARASSAKRYGFCITSEGITPHSSLIRTHASDQIPPSCFSYPYSTGSLQVVVSPCW